MLASQQNPAPNLGSGQNLSQLPPSGVLTEQVCIPNISTSERRKRLVFGLVELAIALAVLAVLMALGVDRWWRLALFLLFAGAASGFFQWRDHT
jgi:hypothetical protein